MGGLGPGSAERLRHAAYWSSWADTVRALRKHQPGVLAALLRPLLDASATGTPPSMRAAEQAARFLRSKSFSAPTWARLLEKDAAAPAPRNTTRSRWKTGLATRGIESPRQARARDALPRHRRNVSSAAAVTGWRCSKLRLHGPPNERRHPGAGRGVPSHPSPQTPAAPPLAPQRCPCGGRLDEYGDHRSACAQVGALARRAGPLGRAAARICKEAGARVASHVALRDLDLDVPAGDGRRVEIVANGIPIWQGAQIAVDATIVRPVRRDGQSRPQG